MKKLVLILLTLSAFTANAQTFVKFKFEFAGVKNETTAVNSDYNYWMGLETERKVGIRTAITSGILYKGFQFETYTADGWGYTDYMTYARDYLNNDALESSTLGGASPDIHFHYLSVPLGVKLYSRYFFSLRYQVSANYLLNNPQFKEDDIQVPLQYNKPSRWLFDNTITLAYTAFGIVDIFASYTISFNSIIEKAPYTYDFMSNFKLKPTTLSYGMTLPLFKIKRKHI